MKEKNLIIILTIIVSISGLSQGMLLPLIAYLFEQSHVPSYINGLHATSLYIGIFVISLFLEGLLRKWGYKRLIVAGGVLVALSFVLFPLFPSMSFWFVLRLIIGMGDNMLHFSTQSWLTAVVDRSKIGRTIAIYGLSFSVGFMIGPIIAQLVEIHESLPFLISAVLTACACSLVMLLKNAYPPSDTHMISIRSTLINFKRVIHTSWVAFLFPMVFGAIESMLNSNFPVFALKHQLTLADITWILPSFSLGTILFQIPVGSLTDRHDRAKVMLILTTIGGAILLLGDYFITERLIMMTLFFLSGIFIGSLYSLGISYMTEITPVSLLAAGNLMCGIAYSIGSIAGPALGGTVIQVTHHQSFFIMISLLVFGCSAANFYKIKINSSH